MRLFVSYMKAHIRFAAAQVLFAAVFMAVLELYDIHVSALRYAVIICLFIGTIFIAVDFYFYRKRVAELEMLVNEISLTPDNLPEPQNDAEAGYIRLVRKLYEDKQSLENEMSSKYSDMSDYYTMWAHQIKTPIAAMRLTLQSEEIPLFAELFEDLQRIEHYADMVMCYLRLDSIYTDYVIKEYDLDGIVRQAVRKFSRQFIHKKICLVYKPFDKAVLTDEKWLLFVIEQVLSNALKYTREGSVELYIEEPLTLCVRDTGIGIAPEDLPRIFDRGYTGFNGRADKKASGIGLYLCREICTRLGHGISAESDENGATIRIRLARDKLEFE